MTRLEYGMQNTLESVKDRNAHSQCLQYVENVPGIGSF